MIESRIYTANQSCVFRKTKEQYGGLSNMAAGFPLTMNDICFQSPEALYQACRFPHLPDVQKKILSEKSPMSAKMVGKPYRKDTRQDWDKIRNRVMRWCLKVKLAQHFVTFGPLLESTLDKPIVEDSPKDSYWGAIRDKNDPDVLRGINALGRLLMEIRQTYNESRFSSDIFLIEPLDVPNFKIMGKQIDLIDERAKFISFVAQSLYVNPKSFLHNPVRINGVISKNHHQKTPPKDNGCSDSMFSIKSA